tara:strand:+ start:43553 stop:43675 length:123 start_codon:yes stop_codon:yes gene_type:complete
MGFASISILFSTLLLKGCDDLILMKVDRQSKPGTPDQFSY